MSSTLGGRVALVTGASGGTGQALARRLAAVAILSSPYLTNQVISLDGGMYPR